MIKNLNRIATAEVVKNTIVQLFDVWPKLSKMRPEIKGAQKPEELATVFANALITPANSGL